MDGPAPEMAPEKAFFVTRSGFSNDLRAGLPGASNSIDF